MAILCQDKLKQICRKAGVKAVREFPGVPPNGNIVAVTADIDTDAKFKGGIN
jgi:hypothetical protein